MRHASVYRRFDRSGLCQPGPTAMRAGIFLAVVCLSFGAVVATFGPVSLEQRLGNLFFFGLIPAVGFYAGGHILGRLLVLVSKVCDMIVARCSRCAVLLVNDLLSSVDADDPSSPGRVPVRHQKACYSAHRGYWRVYRAIFDISCLLIRSAARFMIRIQGSKAYEG